MKFHFKSLWIAAAAAFSFAAVAADPIKIGVRRSVHRRFVLDGRDHARRRANWRSTRSTSRWRARPPDRIGRARRRGEERTRRADRPGADQQGKGRRHRRLHQHRRGAGLAALLPGSEDSGDQQRRDRHDRHEAVRRPEPDNYVFRNSANDTHPVADDRRGSVVKRRFKKVAILADSTNYGQLGREDLEKALLTKGIKPVAVEKFNIKDVDMTAQLLKAKEAGAEVVLTYGIGPELAQIANGMDQARLEGADDRQLDLVDGQLHRQRRHRTATARACRRPSSRTPTRPSARPSSTPT